MHVGPRYAWIADVLSGIGAGCLLGGLLMIYMSKVGKLRIRDRVLGMVSWRGNERVLDVGCGRGLLLIGAAKRLSSGAAVGVDIWSGKDLSGNTAEATIRNARAEGVAERVEVTGGDGRALPFADGSFDVVVSSTALHNIPDAAGRERAVREIARVLRPGGRVVISDIRYLADYAAAFRDAGMQAEIKRPLLMGVLFPMMTMGAIRPGYVTAVKSGAT
jgi:ubiquinone/menaquinone biosynthesis C-methylase UbiE